MSGTLGLSRGALGRARLDNRRNCHKRWLSATSAAHDANSKQAKRWKGEVRAWALVKDTGEPNCPQTEAGEGVRPLSLRQKVPLL